MQSFGKLSFSSDLKTTRISHSAGALECQKCKFFFCVIVANEHEHGFTFFFFVCKVYNSTGECILWMTTTGFHRYLADDESCCIDNPNITSVSVKFVHFKCFFLGLQHTRRVTTRRLAATGWSTPCSMAAQSLAVATAIAGSRNTQCVYKKIIAVWF